MWGSICWASSSKTKLKETLVSYLTESIAIYKRLLEQSEAQNAAEEEYVEEIYQGKKDMLISQRIIKDQKFMKLPGPEKDWSETLSRIRQDVLRAHKVLISDYGIGQPEGKTMSEIRLMLFGEDSRQAQDKRTQVFAQFARPPFPVTLLESDSFVLLVREYTAVQVKEAVLHYDLQDIDAGARCFSVRSVDKFGIVGAYEQAIIYSPSGKTRNFYTPLTKFLRDAVKANQVPPEKIENMVRMCVVYGWIACDALTLMNCRNIESISYTPTKRELAHLPKVVQAAFVYHILNLQRTRKVYTSLDAMTDDAFTREAKTNAKAHVVRGHFKQTRTGLFWWNSFLRNAKNMKDHGYVDKAYKLQRDEPDPSAPAA